MRAAVRVLVLVATLVIACRGAAPPPPIPEPAPLPPPPPLPRAESPRSWAVLDTGATRLTIFVATTRRAVPSERPSERYGPDDADALQFAAVGVNVPSYRARGTGELPRPGGLRNVLTYRPDPQREFFVASVIPVDSNRFAQRVAADLAATRSRDLLVFVHGFNSSFEDAAVRAAQLAADVSFDGAVMLFSWPSAASVTSYVRDQQTARNAGYHLLRLLAAIAPQALPDRIHLLGHSMGSEVVGKAMTLAAPADSLPRFAQVVLAAPDLDARVFRREILPRLEPRAARITLYASDDDEALRASRVLNGVWRLGLGGDSLTVVRGMDTIDASRVHADALGHTLFGNQAFLADLAALLAEGKSPVERRLLAVQQGELTYWRFRGDPR
ncbi:MAG TPA: alpha/beta hydrolase [Gemmatimonadaceae bacterium]|nr:alpha/beta hydrolase [Gemmatimonadaceae bacterium]